MGKFEISTIATMAVFAGIWFGMRGGGGAPASHATAGVLWLDQTSFESRISHGSGLAIVEFYADW